MRIIKVVVKVTDHEVPNNFGGIILLQDSATEEELVSFDFQRDEDLENPGTITFVVYRRHREFLEFTSTPDVFANGEQALHGLEDDQALFLELIGPTMQGLALNTSVDLNTAPEGAQVITITDAAKLQQLEALCA
jgi:hypothetical protein